MRKKSLVVITFVVALGVGRAWAQAANTNNPSAPSANRPKIGTATVAPTGIPPSQRNPLLADNGAVRIGKLVGTSIYNKDDKKIGSVDDVLANNDGQLHVVVATNNKKVMVSWSELQLGNAKLNSDNKVLMLNETQAKLNSLPTFSYTNK